MLTTIALGFSNHGNPASVLRVSKIPMIKEQNCSLLLRHLASPINPSDLNSVSGKYPIVANKVPGSNLIVGGFEGAARIEAIQGQAVDALGRNLLVGDFVINYGSLSGTWRRDSYADPRKTIKVPNTIDPIHAATMAVNPFTAYRLLRYPGVNLQKGDYIIQNCANSAVGQAVIQMANWLGYHTINVIRDRPNKSELVDHLKSLGADHVVTEKEIKQFLKSFGHKCKVAFDAVGGENSLLISRGLEKNSKMIVYGAMSLQPTQTSAGLLIFSNISVCGFWLSRWLKENAATKELQEMVDFICDHLEKKKLEMPQVECVEISPENRIDFSSTKKLVIKF